MLDIMVFFVGALALAAISRRSLADWQSHGFRRFLAFETLWALIVMNARAWFRSPLSAHQILSWVLLAGSIALALAGFLALRRSGRARPAPAGSPLYGFENTSRLVTSGIYRKLRHPMYASLILLGWGAALKTVSFWSVVVAAGTTALLLLTARAEELENLERFGQAYDDYMDRSRMFIPGLF